MDVAKIKAVLLASVGNPESGAINDFADVMALAIAKELEPKQEANSFKPVKETRIQKISETR